MGRYWCKEGHSTRSAGKLSLQVATHPLVAFQPNGHVVKGMINVQARERYEEDKYSAEKVANFVLSEARSSRTRDNTTVIFLDFNTKRTASCN